MKKCITCKLLQEDEQFSLRRTGGTVRRNECKKCHAAREKARKAGKTPKKAATEPVGVLKKCRKCGVEKDLSMFDKNAQGHDGHHSRCKSCRSAANTAYILGQDTGVEEERGNNPCENQKVEKVLLPKTLQKH